MQGGEESRWICLYTPYIDSKKTVVQGRRIPLEKACESPTIMEMGDSVKYLKFQYKIEAKTYSRDIAAFGRLRVQLKDADGKPVNPDITTRKALMLEIAKLVPKHAGRQGAKKGGVPQLAGIGSAPAAGGSAAGGSGGGGSGKKGKKGKK